MKAFIKKHKVISTISALVVIWLIFCAVVTVAQDKKPIAKIDQDKVTLPVKEDVTPDSLFISINETRVTNNLSPFSRNTKLDESSTLKCNDMVANNYYDHQNPTTGKHGYTYVEDLGVSFRWGSENLNDGTFYSSKDVVDSWMNSESHRNSIIDPQFTEIGFAVCQNPKTPGQTMVVQHKINPAQ